MHQKKLQIKTKHHYIWANYLLNWSENDKDIYYLTKSSKIGYDSCKGLAQEGNFYRISNLSIEHVNVIKKISSYSPNELQNEHHEYLRRFLSLQVLESSYTSSPIKDEKAERFIRAFKNNALENLHASHENEAKGIIQSLINEDITILTDKIILAKFLGFLAQQLTRTKSAKENFIKLQESKTNDDEKHTSKLITDAWWFISYILGLNLAHSLFCEHEKYHMSLLTNKTEIPFITSDQPVINIHSYLNPNDKSCNAIDLYYPLSPTVAFFMSKKYLFPNNAFISDMRTINSLNIEIAKHSNIHLFGNNSVAIRNLKKYVGDYHNHIREKSAN